MRLLPLLTIGSCLLLAAPQAPAQAVNTSQQVTLEGLLTSANHGNVTAASYAPDGSLILLLDEHDGIRLLKTNPTATTPLAQAHQGADIWVIGGAEIYAQVLPDADELFITQIAANFGCDTFFPDFETMFHLGEQSETHSQNGFSYAFCRYLKNAVNS